MMKKNRLTLVVLALVMSMSGCAAQTPSCFQSTGSRVLPDPERVLEAITHGEEGRAITQAVLSGDHETVATLTGQNPDLLEAHVPKVAYPDFAPDGQFGDLMMLAVSRCDIEMIDTLIAAGLSPDGVHHGEALRLTVYADTPELAAALLERGADPNAQILNPYADAMRLAYQARNVEAARLLLDAGADVDWADSNGYTHLHSAAIAGSMEVAEALIDAGADPWRVNNFGAIPALHFPGRTVFASQAEEEAHARLIERLNQWGAGWPPPATVPEMRRLILAGDWPNAAQREAGVPDVPPDILEFLRENFGPDGRRR